MPHIPLRDLVGNRPLHAVAPDATLMEAITMICADWTEGALPVVAGDTLVGIVSKRDLLCRGVAKRLDLDTTPVAEIMTRDPLTVGIDASLADAYRLMRKHDIRHVPVVDGDRAIGLAAYREVPVSIRNLAERFDEFSHGKPQVMEH